MAISNLKPTIGDTRPDKKKRKQKIYELKNFCKIERNSEFFE